VVIFRDMEKVKSKIVDDRFKNFSAEKKLDLSMKFYYSAKELKRAALKQFHPEWNDTKIDEEVRRIFLHART
jgi:hypothetical protein